MAVDIPFRREFSFEYGRLEPVAPGIRRIVARNPSPFTFRGTGTYVVGEGEVAVIDPGPDLDEHVAALLEGLAGEQVTHILDHPHASRPFAGGESGARRQPAPRPTVLARMPEGGAARPGSRKAATGISSPM